MIWGIEDGIKFKTLHEIFQNWKKPKPQSGYWKRPLVLLKIFVSWSWIDWSTIWNVVEQNSYFFAKKVITSIVEQTNRAKYFTELCKRCAPRYFRMKWQHAFVNYANYSVCANAWHLFHTSSIYTSFFDWYCICMHRILYCGMYVETNCILNPRLFLIPLFWNGNIKYNILLKFNVLYLNGTVKSGVIVIKCTLFFQWNLFAELIIPF